jgi:glycerol-3-phosphate acyltransferase PlsY
MHGSVAAFAMILFGYLLGSVPAAYLAGKWVRGIDLREYGSGTVSGSMVYEHVAWWAVIPVAVFDIAKGGIPALIALQLGLGESVAAAAGLASVVGHNWPVFFHFHGGRGLGSMVGLWLVFYPPAVLWLVAWIVFGFFLGDSAPFALASQLTLPTMGSALEAPDIVIPLAWVTAFVTVVKRVEANRRPLPATLPAIVKVLLLRIFFDRDMVSHKDWISQAPDVNKDGE